ncbi:MAG: hypothetical protein AAF824_20175, partial [Bacteroidota bacterium]
MKKVLIAGGSGMIGSLVVGHCLSSEEVSEVRSLLRRPSGTQHPKLQESLIQDFPTYDGKLDLFSGIDTAFFCIGVYTGQVSAQQFKEITLEYAVQFATHLAAQSPHATLCLLSGMGADRTEKSKTAFAKYKGMAENQIATLGLTFYSFRPAYIYPVTPRKEPNAMYAISRALYPLIKLFGEGASIQSTELAEAMFTVGMQGADQEILE